MQEVCPVLPTDMSNGFPLAFSAIVQQMKAVVEADIDGADTVEAKTAKQKELERRIFVKQRNASILTLRRSFQAGLVRAGHVKSTKLADMWDNPSKDDMIHHVWTNLQESYKDNYSEWHVRQKIVK